MRKLGLAVLGLMFATASYAAPPKSATGLLSWSPSFSVQSSYSCAAMVPTIAGYAWNVYYMSITTASTAYPYQWVIERNSEDYIYKGTFDTTGAKPSWAAGNLGIFIDGISLVRVNHTAVLTSADCSNIKLHLFYELVPLQ